MSEYFIHEIEPAIVAANRGYAPWKRRALNLLYQNGATHYVLLHSSWTGISKGRKRSNMGKFYDLLDKGIIVNGKGLPYVFVRREYGAKCGGLSVETYIGLRIAVGAGDKGGEHE